MLPPLDRLFLSKEVHASNPLDMNRRLSPF